MAGLDFRRGADLFISSEGELAAALGVSAVDLGRYRRQPDSAPPDLLARLGTILVERGRAMERVGELLQEAHAD
jgi:hypothetical protein